MNLSKVYSSDIFKQLNETHRPLIITQNGKAKAVLQNLENFENKKNILGLLKLVAQGKQAIKNDETITNEEV